MQKNVFIKRSLIIGILALLIGINFTPTLAGDKVEKTTSSNELVEYIRYDDFEDYYIGEVPKSERGWSTSGVTSNQYCEAVVDPLDPGNMVMLVHGSSIDSGVWCRLQQEDFAPSGNYIIHFRIYTPQLSTSKTIYEFLIEDPDEYLVVIHRETGKIRWGGDSFCGGYYEFTPPINPSTTNWIEEELRVKTDEFRLWHDNSIDALGGYCITPVDGMDTWRISNYPSITQSFYIDDFWIIEYNLAPNPPSNPSPGNKETDVDPDTDLSWTCSDPDEDDITYNVYFGDFTPPPLISIGHEDTTYDPGTMNFETKYYWKIEAEDEHGALTTGPIWSFTTIKNDAPSKPIINGPHTGTAGISYTYTFVSIDPDGDDVFYQINWGDGTFEDWFGPYDSNDIITVQHKWSKKGNYTIMARAKDINDNIGEWGTFTVTMPRDKEMSNSLLLQFLQRYPLLNLLVQHFLI